jgi:hypothetical protein
VHVFRRATVFKAKIGLKAAVFRRPILCACEYTPRNALGIPNEADGYCIAFQ